MKLILMVTICFFVFVVIKIVFRALLIATTIEPNIIKIRGEIYIGTFQYKQH